MILFITSSLCLINELAVPEISTVNSEVRSRLAYDIQNQHVLHKIELKCTGEKKHCMFICDLAVNLIIKVPQAKPGELIN